MDTEPREEERVETHTVQFNLFTAEIYLQFVQLPCFEQSFSTNDYSCANTPYYFNAFFEVILATVCRSWMDAQSHGFIMSFSPIRIKLTKYFANTSMG